MLRTALLSAMLAFAGYAAAAWLTHGFQVWTAEGARRLEVALQPVPSPAVAIDGHGIAPQTLPQLFADGQSVTLVDFIYTRCQTVCLAMGSSFQQLQQALQERGGNVRLLSISFDGQHDKPAVLQAYSEKLSADPAVWRFVRVQDPQETQRLLRDFQVVVVPNGRGDFEHNAALLVVDNKGRLVRIFDYAEQQLALDYAYHLAGAAAPSTSPSP
ncbi:MULTISPECIES: SCO family protein [unclassified Polaromonas]|uniref:SCO family protein n=1 Tax=unclassified Polaromonas TaxID=2638319 RepID=UPI000F0962E1|nr:MULTISPECIES: SCO family protein [unclassified Polaromonas]AYQ26779.1 SCO family protein [Polaromonas sp. SP1]QGJ18373.1 SCO family protein [Polaromonas sp. Pch-P]